MGIGTFLIFFSAYDAVAGIATGLAMRHARDLLLLHERPWLRVRPSNPGTALWSVLHRWE
jgi:hypothetical protein